MAEKIESSPEDAHRRKIEELERLCEGTTWVLPTDLDIVEASEKVFQNRLRAIHEGDTQRWSDEEIENLSLGFHEIVINAILHGNLEIGSVESDKITQAVEQVLKNKPEFAKRRVTVALEADRNAIKAAIGDEGKGFKLEDVPDATTPENISKSQGRGTLLAREFWNDVKVQATPNGLLVSLEKIWGKETPRAMEGRKKAES